jgi:ABC-type multidrug transport system fused ATPase/permease subunit
MVDTFQKLRDLLDKRERRNAVLLFTLMLAMALLETTGVASIMPFIAVLSDPELIKTNDVLAGVYERLGFSSTHSFLIFIGSGVFCLVVGSLGFKAFTFWAMARFTHMRGYTLSCRLLRGCLDQPYPWFLNRHSADIGKSVLSEVGQVINGSLMPAMELIAQTVVALFLTILVVAVEPAVAITAVSVLGGAYALIYTVVRRYLTRIGADRVRANRERYQIAQEALGGIKDVKVLGLEEGYLRSYKKPAARFAKRQASNQIIGALPQFLLQGVAFGGILAILLTLLATGEGDLGKVLPLMALYAFAGARLLPAMQHVYHALTKLRFGKPALDTLHKDLKDVAANQPGSANRDPSPPMDSVKLQAQLELRNVSYTYPHAQGPALEDLSLTIQAGTTVALVGSTGAGKTTVADLLLGLLEPQRGELLVDGQRIAGRNIRTWQRNIGYVPQHIFLSDDTVAANIAFGQPDSSIDLEAVERAAKIAELHDFVVNELPDAYETTVGERGVRLSGGQRQRIGIARALYHDPDVLVLDEATSALDNITEKAVMESVHHIARRKTIIIIAHRLTTVENCDAIYLMEHGRIRASGSYQALLLNDQRFQEMAQATATTA